MNDADGPQPGAALVYEDRIPIAWQALEQLPAAWQLLKAQQSNEQVLRYLASVDDHQQRHDTGEDDHGPVSNEIARLESKLNLLMDMVGRLLGEQVELPPEAPVRINADGLQWQTDNPPATGSLVSVELCLNPRFPSPIVLHGRIERVTPVEGIFRVEMSYSDMSDTVRNGIEKMVFRQHRRLVALSRKGH